MVHPLDLPKSTKISKIQNPKSPKSKIPKIQNPLNPKSPKSKIQNPKSPKSKIPNPPNPKSKIPNPQILDFGGRFWILGILKILGILDFGSWGFRILDFGFGGFWILDLGISDFGFWILGILDFGFWGFWILDFRFWGFWILDFGDFGFWILDRYVANLYVRPPTPQIWGILDFGDFGDFGFWGFWILDFGDFGFWILEFGDFGFWILDFVTNFGFYIRKRRLCTPTRVGGFLVTRHTFEAAKFVSRRVFLRRFFRSQEGKPADTKWPSGWPAVNSIDLGWKCNSL